MAAELIYGPYLCAFRECLNGSDWYYLLNVYFLSLGSLTCLNTAADWLRECAGSCLFFSAPTPCFLYSFCYGDVVPWWKLCLSSTVTVVARVHKFSPRKTRCSLWIMLRFQYTVLYPDSAWGSDHMGSFRKPLRDFVEGWNISWC